MLECTSEATKDPLDYYPTPPEVTRALVRRHADVFTGPVLEPAAGTGHILRVLRELGVGPLWAIELHAERCVAMRRHADRAWRADYLGADLFHPAADLPSAPRIIIGNPPGSLNQAFVERSLGLVAEGGHVFLLMQAGFLWTVGRRALFSHGSGFRWLHPLTPRPRFTGTGTSVQEWAWFGWTRGFEGAPVIEHLSIRGGGPCA